MSLSFWAGEGRFRQTSTLPAEEGDLSWPQRTYVGFGEKEYTGTRNNGRDDVDRKLVSYLETFVDTLRRKGGLEEGNAAGAEKRLGGADWRRAFLKKRFVYDLVPEAGHTEKTWADMFPDVLDYVFGHMLGEDDTAEDDATAAAVSATVASAPIVQGQIVPRPLLLLPRVGIRRRRCGSCCARLLPRLRRNGRRSERR